VALAPGTQLGSYQIVSLAGEGNFSEVYEARETNTGRTVAVKLLRGVPSARELDLTRLAATLVHPNIVRTLDVFRPRGQLCLAMEWADGGSLEALLDARGTLGHDEIIRLGRDVASALDFAHGHGVLHRDLKPSNVLLIGARYALTDFGVSGILQHDTQLTSAGEFAGTPLYMSPEQATGVSQSVASDVFGLGLLLYRCVYGTVPGGESGGLLALLRSRVIDEIVVPPSPFQALLSWCLARDPAARPQSAREVATALALLATPSEPMAEEERAATPPATAPQMAGAPPVPTMSGAAPTATAPPDWQSFRVAQPASRAATRATSWMWLALASGAALSVAGLIVWPRVGRVLAGLAIVALGLALAWTVRRRPASRSPQIERRASQVLFGAGRHEDLTKSLIIEVDKVIGSLRTLDARVMGMTLLAMIDEYDTAKQSTDRQGALINVVTIMEKLQIRLSPWHVRHKDAIATAIAVVGCLSGTASAVSGFLA
jgi:hypothetical protein